MLTIYIKKCLFPVLTGMNRAWVVVNATKSPVPRAYGDEPDAEKEIEAAKNCSPCLRG